MAVLYSQERNIKVSIEICHNQNYDVVGVLRLNENYDV